MPDTQLYRFFLDSDTEPFLFSVRLNVEFKPKIGDSMTDPTTLKNFRVMRFKINAVPQNSFRITDDNISRVTDDGRFRVTGTGAILNLNSLGRDYFIQPANNPNRISTWTTNTFDDDKVLKQLFR